MARFRSAPPVDRTIRFRFLCHSIFLRCVGRIAAFGSAFFCCDFSDFSRDSRFECSLFALMADVIRYCATEGCRSKLPFVRYDGHTKCAECIGQLCNDHNRCQECSSWSSDAINAYVAHRRMLLASRERKARSRAKKASQANTVSDSGSDSASISSVFVVPVSNNPSTSKQPLPPKLPTSTSPSTHAGIDAKLDWLTSSIVTLTESVSSLTQSVAVLQKGVSPPSSEGSHMGPPVLPAPDPQVSIAHCARGAGGISPGGEWVPVGSCHPNVNPRSRPRPNDNVDDYFAEDRFTFKRALSPSDHSSDDEQLRTFKANKRKRKDVYLLASQRVEFERSQREGFLQQSVLSQPVLDVGVRGVGVADTQVSQASCLPGTQVCAQGQVQSTHETTVFQSVPTVETNVSPVVGTTEFQAFQIGGTPVVQVSQASQASHSLDYNAFQTVPTSGPVTVLVSEPFEVPVLSEHASPWFTDAPKETTVSSIANRIGNIVDHLHSARLAFEPKPSTLVSSGTREQLGSFVNPSSNQECHVGLREGLDSLNVLGGCDTSNLYVAPSNLVPSAPVEPVVSLSLPSFTNLVPSAHSSVLVTVASTTVTPAPIVTSVPVLQAPVPVPTQQILPLQTQLPSSHLSHVQVTPVSSAPVLATSAQPLVTVPLTSSDSEVQTVTLVEKSVEDIQAAHSTEQKIDTIVHSTLEEGDGNETPDQDIEQEITHTSDYRKLLAKIAEKWLPNLQEEAKLAGTTYKMTKTQEVKQIIKLPWSKSVTTWLTLTDSLLNSKRQANKPSPSLPLFLRAPLAQCYFTGDTTPSGFKFESGGELSSILDEYKSKNINSSKVSFSMTEADLLCKGFHRILEIGSFIDWSIGAILTSLEELRAVVPPDHSDAIDTILGYGKVLDRAAEHSIGETIYALSNIVLKKREHVLGMLSKNVSPCKKAALLFAPVSDLTLFKDETVRSVCEDVARISTNQILVQTAKEALIKRNLAAMQSYKPSPLGPTRSKGSKKFFPHKGQQSKQNRSYTRKGQKPKPSANNNTTQPPKQ